MTSAVSLESEANFFSNFLMGRMRSQRPLKCRDFRPEDQRPIL